MPVEACRPAKDVRDLFNVVGMISAVNLTRSAGVPLGNVFYFDKIAIDPLKARDLPLFRVKESPVEVIVLESVARVSGQAKTEGLVLEPASTTPAAQPEG